MTLLPKSKWRRLFLAVVVLLLVSCSRKGPEAVDLGLSVKWASFNLGGSSPEDYGDYYAWGETKIKENYSQETYKWNSGDEEAPLTKYNADGFYGIVDNKITLEPKDDVAHVKLGGKWRMPTIEEWEELKTECTWTWTRKKWVNGYKVTGKNGNSIFLPAAGLWNGTGVEYSESIGCYWSSLLYTKLPYFAAYVYFRPDEVEWDVNWRDVGRSVRAVSE